MILEPVRSIVVSMTTTRDPRPAGAVGADASAQPADVFVAFGISGDLAKVMTLRSLYRLERRGLLDCPIVGVAVDDWTADDLRQRAREAIVDGGDELDEEVFARFADRLSYISGDFGDNDTYELLKRHLGDAQAPVFYLEIPPFLFGTVVKGLHDAGLTENARVVVEKPFGHDLDSARELAEELHRYIHESQLFRIDHFLGKMGLVELMWLRHANAILEPVWNRSSIASVQITMAEAFGVSDRGHFYDPVGALRDVVVNHLMQVVAATAMEPPGARSARALKDGVFSLFSSMPPADPKYYVRGQYDGYLDVDGVAPDSTTETYAALRLEIDNWRWTGVPFFIRTGKLLRATQTEVRVVFHKAPRIGFHDAGRGPEANQLIVKLDPSTGIRLEIDAKRHGAAMPEPIQLDMEFAEEGGEGAAPYEVLLLAAMRGDATRFTRQDGVEEAWRIMAPLLESPPPVHPYAPGTWGPQAADGIVAGDGHWHEPWVIA
jgi:glucose-6-phosphate 1-dehydrogenase